MADTIEARLEELGINLPSPSAPAANYVASLVVDNQLFISGQLPMGSEGLAFQGRVDDQQSLEQAKAAARLCAINILAQAKAALGNLERIRQTLRLTGFVNATPEFAEHPAVINGASDLIGDVLGDRGRHTRAAVGVAGLPFNASVEIDALFAISQS